MSIIKRMKEPTPSFFRRLRNIGIAAATAGAAIVASPVEMPAVLVKVAGYLAVAGTIASAISQSVTKNEGQEEDE